MLGKELVDYYFGISGIGFIDMLANIIGMVIAILIYIYINESLIYKIKIKQNT
jgi:uncharacterized membrane protein YdjX (TVP38/TMEM64 family)